MPKNMFQRPLRVARDNKVPRHGTPLPMSKVMASKVVQPREPGPSLPPLDTLLGRKH